MAETLGITPYSPAVDINYARMTSDGLQSLGAQLREDMIAIQANRQVKNLGQQLSQIDPTSDQFPQQLAQAAVANPLGSLHPVGRLAIETLGAAHKQHEASLLQEKRLAAQENRPSFGGFGSGGILNRKTGEVLREPNAIGGGAEFSGLGGGGIYNRKTGEVVREPASRSVDPALKEFEADKNRLQAAILKAETELQRSAGGLDLEKLQTAKKTYRVNAKDKQADDGEFVVMELADGTKSKLDWKTFSKINGNITAVEKLRGELSSLKPPVPKVSVSIPTSSPTIEGDLPSGEEIAGSLDLIPGSATQGKALDAATARALLREAGGDKAKARELAVQRGYSL